ncbi:FAD-dependent monooxygenase [Streptomyces sp. ISL-94]|uniref:FAD-dependent oxidoreductase n=1 Tax=Streptomyces sp. ISL-94 TaxID=2819190 RepID=UPI001BEC4E7E|nr:FAD-dependent monooxygenase [Streptomyces sp. ISL-94]MBT2481986.1 FAD-dependent monooxygenase [Streptomyces sp. ISL-94]
MTFAGLENVWGAPILGILRHRLHGVLLDQADKAGVEVRAGAAVTGYREAVGAITVVMADTSTVDGDLLIGADGLRSAVRAQMLDDGEPVYRGFSAVRSVGQAPPAHPHGFLAYGRGLILFTAAIGDGNVYWVASITAPQNAWPSKDGATAHRDLLHLMKGWDPSLTRVVAEADPQTLVLTDIYDRDPVTTWHRGRAVLLGDAAHPMVYTMGQGANVTLEDGTCLVHHLARGTAVNEALSAYTAERAPRTAKITKQSRMMGSIGQTTNPAAAWFRNRMMTLMTPGNPNKQNADVFGWQPPGP